MIREFLTMAFFFAVGSGVLALVVQRYTRRERIWIFVGYLAHAGGVVAQVLVTRYVYGGGDMFAYFRTGTVLAEYLMSDFGFYFPRILELILGGEPTLPFHVVGEGSSTGAMAGIEALFLVITGGSLYASCLLFGVSAFAGQLSIYHVLRDTLPRWLRQRNLFACFLIPSVVFWSSAILKEPIALGGLGIAFLGLHRLFFTSHRLRGAGLLVGGGFLAALAKPYVLFPLAIAAAAWFYRVQILKSRGPNRAIKQPFYLAIAIAIAVGALVWLGNKYPRFAAENLTSETSHLQEMYYDTGGGSTYKYDATGEQHQIQNVPIALVSSLFRPFIFEAHNATSAVNALETFAIVILLVMLGAKRGLRNIVREIWGSPLLLFMATYVLTMAIAIGLGAPNLGSLSRYRVPMMIFYVALLLSLLPRSTDSKQVVEPQTHRPPASTS